MHLYNEMGNAMPNHWALDAALASRGVVICVALGLSACGGGGGGSNVKPTPPPPPPPVVDTSPMVVSTDLTVASGQKITRPIVLEGGADLDNQGVIGGSAVDVAVDAKASSIVTNRGPGAIRSAKTAIRLEHGGEIHNEAGATIEAMGTSGVDCGATAKCAIYSGRNEQASYDQAEFTLVNKGTIIGNVKVDPEARSSIQLFAGSVIRGDLDAHGSLELAGEAGTVQRYSQAVTGNTTPSSNVAAIGDGTWIIDVDNIGNLTGVTGGTLRIGDGGTKGSITSDSAVRLREGGILVFDRSDEVVFGGRILGSHDPEKLGTLVQAGTGVLVLTTDFLAPDAILIERGTLQIHNTGGTPGATESMGVGAITNNGALVFDSRSYVQAGAVSGTGSVTQNGSAGLMLAGLNTYTGGTTINGGVLLAEYALPGNVVVNAGGSLGGETDYTTSPTGVPAVDGNLVNGGMTVVAGGNTMVAGHYTQSATGTLSVSLGNKLEIGGTATLQGGTLEMTAPTSYFEQNAHTEVLTASGGIVGTFGQLVKAPGVVFVSNTINYDANSVWLDTTGLDITQAAMGNGIGYTPASMGSAVRVQGAFEQLNDRISTDSLSGVSSDFLRSAGQFQRAASIEAAQASLRSLSGELHAASAAMTFRAIDAGNQALSDHLDALRDGRAASGMWTQQLGSGGGMARSGFDGVGFQMDGWLVGNDFRVGRAGVVGFAFGQGQGVQQLQGGADRDSSRRTEGMVYAGLASDRWYAQGRLGFGEFRQDVSRALLLGNRADGVWTRYGGRYQVAYGESGLRYGFGDVRIAPFASLQYARSQRDAFEEAGAGGFGLRSDAQSLDRWQAAVGVRAARRWNFGRGRTLGVGAHAQWFRASGTDGGAMEASFVGLQQWSPLLGIGVSRYGGLFGVGLDAQLSRNATLKVGYDYERGQFDNAHGMSAGLNVAF